MTEKRHSRPNRGEASRQRPGSAALRLAMVDELEVEVEKLVAGGDGLARWQGIPIFVPRSAPGDRLRIRLTERRPDYGRAEIVEILSPGKGRREPSCVHFGDCGGCDLQHLDDDLQTDLKVAAVSETLWRLGGVEVEESVEVIRGSAWAYRRRAQVHTSSRSGELRVGFRTRRGSDVVPVEMCPVMVPELERQIVGLRELLAEEPPRRIDLVVGEEDRLSSAPRMPGLPQGEISIEVDELTFRLDARCFFQAHRQLVGELVRHVVGDWRGETAVDLYAGVGLFSLALARLYREVVAVEGDSVAGRYLRKNARLNHFDRLRSIHSAADSWIRQLPEGVDRVVVDPPRTGLSGKVCNTLMARRARRLTYVSCHPAALARDLRVLQEQFRLERTVMVDLFPQTGHMEVIAQLVAR